MKLLGAARSDFGALSASFHKAGITKAKVLTTIFALLFSTQNEMENVFTLLNHFCVFVFFQRGTAKCRGTASQLLVVLATTPEEATEPKEGSF